MFDMSIANYFDYEQRAAGRAGPFGSKMQTGRAGPGPA